MDLALALGMTERQLSRAMSERELRRWMAYANKRSLPPARLEAYLAQVAYVLAQTAGAADMSLKDFMLDFSGKGKKPTAEEGAFAIANLAQGPGVRKLGQGRKKKVA